MRKLSQISALCAFELSPHRFFLFFIFILVLEFSRLASSRSPSSLKKRRFCSPSKNTCAVQQVNPRSFLKHAEFTGAAFTPNSSHPQGQGTKSFHRSPLQRARLSLSLEHKQQLQLVQWHFLNSCVIRAHFYGSTTQVCFAFRLQLGEARVGEGCVQHK